MNNSKKIIKHEGKKEYLAQLMINAIMPNQPIMKDFYYFEKSLDECDFAIYMLQKYGDIDAYNYLSTKSIKDYKNIKYEPFYQVTKEICTAKFINCDTKESSMNIEELFSKAQKGVEVGIAIVEGFDHRKDIQKIIEYYTTAMHAKTIYGDPKVYNYLRRECITTFQTIENIIIKEKITKLVNPEFLKYKP